LISMQYTENLYYSKTNLQSQIVKIHSDVHVSSQKINRYQ
jgi:hypothetical protein